MTCIGYTSCVYLNFETVLSRPSRSQNLQFKHHPKALAKVYEIHTSQFGNNTMFFLQISALKCSGEDCLFLDERCDFFKNTSDCNNKTL